MADRLTKGNRPKIGYLCSYFPSKLFDQLGLDTFSFGETAYDNLLMNSDLPVNICGYVRYCQKIIDETTVDGIVLTNCCNGMQRLYDYIKLKRPELFCGLIELPRDNSISDYDFFYESIKNSLAMVSKYFAIRYSDDVFDKVRSMEKDENEIAAGTIYILGSAISSQMREKLVEYLKPYPVKMNSCTQRNNGGNLVHLLNDYHLGKGRKAPVGALSLDSIEPCARMNCFVSWFANFIAKNRFRLAGIIYISSQHCDSFLFSFPSIQKICKQYGLPILGMEEGYRLTGFGQTLTRLEAFLESLCFNRIQSSKAVENVENIKSKDESANIFRRRMHLVSGILPTLPLRAIQKVVSNQIDLFTKKSWESPEKIIWTNMVMTVELIYAAGLIPINMELVAGWLASLGLSRRYISRIEGMGFSPTICSYHKATLGLLEEGGLPHPRRAAISSHLCDGGPAVVNYLAKNYNTDTFILNVPFHDGALELQYMIKQYSDLMKWIADFTGSQVKEEALARALELSNEARKYWNMAFEIRKGRPLFPGHLSLRNLFGATFLFGSQLGVDVAKAYYEQLLEMSKSDKNESDHEKKRVLWIHFAPLYGNNLMNYLERELNCWIVMDITGYIYWPEYDLKKPLESLAKKALSHFYLNEADERQKLYCRLIQEYKIDGIIHFVHNGCRAIPGSSWLVRDIASEYGLPYLELAGDCIDPRGFSEEQMRLRLEAFRETLGSGKFVLRN